MNKLAPALLAALLLGPLTMLFAADAPKPAGKPNILNGPNQSSPDAMASVCPRSSSLIAFLVGVCFSVSP